MAKLSDINQESIVHNNILLEASKKTLKQLGGCVIFVIGVLLLMAIFYALYLAAGFLIDALSFYHWIFLGVIFSVLILFFMNYYNIYFKERGLKYWKNNSGEKPPFKKISVKYASGKIQAAIDPSDIVWDLSIDDPVIQYKKYEKI